jgi:hypothetical protein
MIYDLERTIHILNIDILTEEERVRVFDRPDPAYPILARMLTARRDKLIVTVADIRNASTLLPRQFLLPSPRRPDHPRMVL